MIISHFSTKVKLYSVVFKGVQIRDLTKSTLVGIALKRRLKEHKLI